MLQLSQITYRVRGRTLLQSANAQIPDRYRVGLIGNNGTGKTTLLRLIYGTEALDEGHIHIRSRASVGIVAQEAPGGEQTPLEAVLAADVVRASLLADAETATDPARIAEIHTALADRGDHAAPARAASILAGLGFDQGAQSRPLRQFSGGYRMRVALASALFCQPDLLLLDEPTNHLDLESSLWLEDYLSTYPNTLLMVSHDRHMLSSAVTHILHLDEGRLEMYTGGYNQFERMRTQRLAQNDALAKRQTRERERIQAFIDHFRSKATKARQAQSRVKLLARMAPIEAIATGRRPSFQFPTPDKAPSPLVRLDDVSIGYSTGQPVLAGLRLSIFADDRIALIGANGNGKTTLARLLAGALEPVAGQVVRSAKVKVGYFAQESLDQLDPGRTPLEQLGPLMPDASPSAIRGWLGRFGLGQEQVELKTADLSGGERTRLALAVMAQGRPNLMILDEPTNHLDIGAREALAGALNRYRGALVIISHDRHLVESTAEQLWLVAGGKTAAFFGDMDDYHRMLREPDKAPRDETDPAAPDRPDRRADRRCKAEARARLAPLKTAVAAAEKALEALLREKKEIEDQLASPEIYSGDLDKLKTLHRRRKALTMKISRAEDRWLESQDALDLALSENTAH